MKKPTLQTVENIEIHVDGHDYPKMYDSYISSATWKDSGEELTEDELYELEENESEWFNKECCERYLGA